MGTLKQDHQYLYKRVKLKGIVHTALGFVLLVFPTSVPSSSAGQVTTAVQSGLSLLGVIYLIIGLGIVIGLFVDDEKHKFLRGMMTVAALYNTFWSLILVAIILDKPNRSTAYIAVIYWYLTYNIWYVRNDPGWRAIEIVKRLVDDEGSSSKSIK